MLTRVKHNLSVGKGFTLTFPAVSTPTNPPYGTIIGSGSEDAQLNWVYSDSTGGSGYFTYGYSPYNILADGNGGSFLSWGTFTETATYNQVINDYIDGHPDYRIIYKGSGTWSECYRYGIATGNTDVGADYVSPSEASGEQYQIGTHYGTEYHDGVCSTYWNYTHDYYTYGTSIGSYGSYTFYSDGNGGYYAESSGGGGCSGATGNTTTETAYVWISEQASDFPAGTRYLSEQYNPDCTTWWNLDYVSWYSNGTPIITNIYCYTDTYGWAYLDFISDGNGGYYYQLTP